MFFRSANEAATTKTKRAGRRRRRGNSAERGDKSIDRRYRALAAAAVCADRSAALGSSRKRVYLFLMSNVRPFCPVFLGQSIDLFQRLSSLSAFYHSLRSCAARAKLSPLRSAARSVRTRPKTVHIGGFYAVADRFLFRSRWKRAEGAHRIDIVQY